MLFRSAILSRSFDHLGSLAVGAGYDRSGAIALPNGLSGTFYVFVSTGGPFEFIYGGNNRRLAGTVEVAVAPSPDVVVTNIAAPLEAQEGESIEIGWTVLNQGDAPADGSWTDTVVMRDVGNPNAAPITLGSFTYSAGLGAGLSYTRTERFTIPRLTGSWRVEVVTNSGKIGRAHV